MKNPSFRIPGVHDSRRVPKRTGRTLLRDFHYCKDVPTTQCQKNLYAHGADPASSKIYSITEIVYMEIQVEPHRTRTNIPHCNRYQYVGHHQS